jgi:hypothetical protein
MVSWWMCHVAVHLQMPTTKRAPVPYIVTLLPPLLLALSFPDVFFNALELAGVFGVLVLFGVLPGAMAWASRYSPTVGRAQVRAGLGHHCSQASMALLAENLA